jgi:SNF2 family DNA or RNA helicase
MESQNLVKKIQKNYVLDVHLELGPHVTHPDGQIVQLSNDLFGRWFARSHYPSMEATPAGASWFSSHNPLRIMKPASIITEPKEHQILGVSRMLLSNSALWFDMGLGKTLTALLYCMRRFEAGKGNMFLIFCPLSCFITWEDEIKKHIDPKAQAKTVIVHGPKRAKKLQDLRIQPHNGPVFIITNYESTSTIIDDLASLPIIAVFCDESSRIKNEEAIRTRNIFKIVRKLPKAARFLMSGTPSTSSPLGFYAQYELLEAGASGHTNFQSFKNDYIISKLFMRVQLPNKIEAHILCEPDDQPEKWLKKNYPPNSAKSYYDLGYTFSRKPGPKAIRILNHYTRAFGTKNLDKLNKVTQKHAYTLKKEDVLTEFPEKHFVRRSVQMSTEQRQLYNEILAKHEVTFKSTKLKFSDRASPYAKLHQVANGFILNEGEAVFCSSIPKIDEIIQIVEEIGDQKLLIWAPYPSLIEHTKKLLEEETKLTALTIHGTTSTEDRKRAVHSFQDPSGASILIANPDVAGMGLNLTVCSVSIFMCNWWKADIRAQAIDRIHRIGQTKDCTIIDLITERTIESKILDDLITKIDTENEIIQFNQLKGEV